MGKRHNYASYTRPLTPPSVEKSKWELYLEELGLEDETAINALRHGTGAAGGVTQRLSRLALVEWCKRHTRTVPYTDEQQTNI